jgi:hypothetical protein
MQRYIENCEDYYVEMKWAKEMKLHNQESEILFGHPNDTDAPIPNAPFDDEDGHLEENPTDNQLDFDKNVDLVDSLESVDDDLNDIPNVLGIAQNLVSSLPRSHHTHLHIFNLQSSKRK